MSGPPWHYDREPEAIARGGQAVIYRAVRSDGLLVAIKVASGGPSTMALQHEIRVLHALGQAQIQGVMRCLDVIDIDGDVGMVMPLYPQHLGQWMQAVCGQPDPDTLDDILQKVATLARTLANVHKLPFANGLIVHRDIKPENIFLDDQGRLAVADFGGAMAITGLRAVELALFGTPMWAPLDQILPGRAIPDPTWDTYA
jgi:serine/threonine protein kinase